VVGDLNARLDAAAGAVLAAATGEADASRSNQPIFPAWTSAEISVATCVVRGSAVNITLLMGFAGCEYVLASFELSDEAQAVIEPHLPSFGSIGLARLNAISAYPCSPE
jgi:hypothetical protein